MYSHSTGVILNAFIHGAIGIIVSGFIIETGDGYAKVLRSNQFSNKWEAAALMGGTAVFGFVIKQLNPYISEFVQSFSPSMRAGFLIIGPMLLLNYKVSDYNYGDFRSWVAYGIGALIMIYPDLNMESKLQRLIEIIGSI